MFKFFYGVNNHMHFCYVKAWSKCGKRTDSGWTVESYKIGIYLIILALSDFKEENTQSERKRMRQGNVKIVPRKIEIKYYVAYV